MAGKIIKNKEMEGTKDLSLPMNPILPSLSDDGKIVRKKELEAKDRGAEVIFAAQREAQQIRKEAELFRSQIQEELEKARQQGLKEGREEAKSEWTEQLVEIKKIKEKFFAEAELQIVKLVLSISEKVIGKLVAEHQAVMHSVVKEALEHALGDKIVVKMHPEDLKRFKEEELQFKDVLDRTKQIHFKEDESVQRGGCIVETEVGTLDAQIETQMKAIRKAFGI